MHQKRSILFLSVLLTLTSCSGEVPSSKEEHVTHVFGEWQRDEQSHYRTCSICGYVEEGSHDDSVCDICASFKILSLGFLEGGDSAHSHFAKEANSWFKEKSKEYGFIYDFSTDFSLLNEETLSHYQVVMFLNNLPYEQSQRQAFENYMRKGGSFMGYHVSAFTTEASSWSWYHDEFLGSGNFRSNTWNPTKETLRVETHDHFATRYLPDTFVSSHNEWYSWEGDLRKNEDIEILLSLDQNTFPVGDREGEIWYEGDYPVAWANKKYNMIYLNMGHNLQSYNDFEKISYTFSSPEECDFILDGTLGLAELSKIH